MTYSRLRSDAMYCKELEACGKPYQTRLIGVEIMGYGSLFYEFWTHPTCKHGANVTCTLLLRSLSLYKEQYEGKPWPEVLFLQLDNTGKENKCDTVLAFCCWLVEAGVFQEVRVAFLPVGHTHVRIDQKFSRISVHLNSEDTLTLPHLMREVSSLFPDLDAVKHEEVPWLGDFDRVFKPVMKHITGTGTVRSETGEKVDVKVFRFFKQDGCSVMVYRQHDRPSSWNGHWRERTTANEQVPLCLWRNEDKTSGVPTTTGIIGVPKRRIEGFDKVVDKIKQLSTYINRLADDPSQEVEAVDEDESQKLKGLLLQHSRLSTRVDHFDVWWNAIIDNELQFWQVIYVRVADTCIHVKMKYVKCCLHRSTLKVPLKQTSALQPFRTYPCKPYQSQLSMQRIGGRRTLCSRPVRTLPTVHIKSLKTHTHWSGLERMGHRTEHSTTPPLTCKMATLHSFVLTRNQALVGEDGRL